MNAEMSRMGLHAPVNVTWEITFMALEECTITKHTYVDLRGQPEKPWHALIT